jgi:hypothetical protein
MSGILTCIQLFSALRDAFVREFPLANAADKARMCCDFVTLMTSTALHDVADFFQPLIQNVLEMPTLLVSGLLTLPLILITLEEIIQRLREGQHVERLTNFQSGDAMIMAYSRQIMETRRRNQ